MNAKRILFPILAVVICTLAACNWTVGDCYPREEWVKGEGAGGPVGPPVPVFTSVASGDFGAEPPSGPEYGSERKIQCNKTDDEDEDEEESPSDSSERPTASPTSPPDPCQQSGTPQMSCNISAFEPSMFQFVTTLAYDGTVAGGWQEATAGLVFRRGVRGVDACTVHIGMPLRTQAWGAISAERAAIISADLVNRIAAKFYEEGLTDLPPGVFCERFKTEIRQRFEKEKEYEGLGARLMG
ncbi:hypothetical protein WME90_12210 [Sorangium sp. So ce375]|uniref:hypothetical protein n=1 Tax=Sorangium sp. So ce375 TaxID=3133306 RepID=UPI003F5BE6F9